MKATTSQGLLSAVVPGAQIDAYGHTEEFFQEALRVALRESVSMPLCLQEPQKVRIKPGFETACWSFQPPHNIFVGTKLFVKPNIKANLTQEQRVRYVKNHYHHEQAHGLFTERDMARINKALKAIQAPFGTYNLFEDAYIEDRYRREAEYEFNWLEYETLMFGDRAESLLFALIQAEGNLETVKNELDLWKPEPLPGELPCPPTTEIAEPPRRVALKDILLRVHWYYQRIINVRHSMAIMPILSMWLDEFGRPEENKDAGGMQDMGLSIAMAMDPKVREQFESDAKPITGPGSDNPDVKAKQADRNHSAVQQSGDLLASEAAHQLDRARVKAVADKLGRLFNQTPRTFRSSTPSSKISARHYVLGRPAYKTQETVSKRVRNIYLEIDCSGSMRGLHIKEGQVLVAALSELAVRGAVKGHVVLSGVVSGIPKYQTFALPMADAVIERIDGMYGAEGLEYSLSANQKLAKDADFVFIYTDAQICDKPIDRAAWHAKGLFTWGLYAGTSSEHVLESMLEYFDKAIIRPTAEELVDAVLNQASKA